jgi:outer membrane PBP1 activator LpoA protein
MAESLDLFNEVRQLRSQVDDLAGMTETLVRAQSKELVKAIMAKFAGDPALSAVFLAVDGVASQTEILTQLKRGKLKGASPATISRKIETLANELHLIELVDHCAKGKIYKRTNLDRILGISRKLGD